jgi:TM2 domain-containing membrane protein YozV
MLRTFFSVDVASMFDSKRFPFAGAGGRKLVWVGVMAMIAMSLQGCDADVLIHKVGNWRAEPDYLITHEFVPPGGKVESSKNINSCSYPGLSPVLQCSGRGTCQRWAGIDNELSFCQCDVAWADPECRTKRKSQTIAFILAIFTGYLGADHFYLGFPLPGLAKLFLTLIGVSFSPCFTFIGVTMIFASGTWWIYDVIRVGSAPVPASGSFLVANDLSHFAYVLSIVLFALFLGFSIAHYITTSRRLKKRRDAMSLVLDEEAHNKPVSTRFTDAYISGKGKEHPYIEQAGYGSMPQGSSTQRPWL